MKYVVDVKITGYQEILIEANTAKEAMEKALDTANYHDGISWVKEIPIWVQPKPIVDNPTKP